MIYRYAPALFFVLLLTQTVQAGVFQAQCDATFGTDKMTYWGAILNTENDSVTNHTHKIGEVTFDLEVRPGGAAFADAVILKVSSAKSEFELMSLLSSEGYGSVIYRGLFDHRKLTTECVVSRLR